MMINERIDDLMRDGLKLIQNTDIFCFGMDAVLLSTYARAGKKDRVLDMGTGNGIIPVLMQSKNPGSTYSALEIQEGSAQLARRNVELNHLEDRISVVKGDIKEASTIFGEASFNVVTSNPPYMNENHGIVNPRLPRPCPYRRIAEAATAALPGWKTGCPVSNPHCPRRCSPRPAGRSLSQPKGSLC